MLLPETMRQALARFQLDNHLTDDQLAHYLRTTEATLARLRRCDRPLSIEGCRALARLFPISADRLASALALVGVVS